MKTFGPNSVSSNLALALKIASVVVAIWFVVAVVGAPISIWVSLVQSHQPPVPIKPTRAFDGTPLTSWTFAVPYVLYEVVAARGAITIVRKLRAVFDSFVANQPFAAENADHLRRIWVTFVVIEIARVAAFVAVRVLTMFYAAGDASPLPREIASPIDLSRWFMIFVVLILAEVFRQGTRLREDSELTV